MNPSSPQRYTGTAIFLHWSLALLFALLIGLGLYMTAQPDGDDKWALYSLHKSIGLLAAWLILLRIVWRWRHPPPPLPDTLNRYEKGLAHAVHSGLYGLMLLMPLSGYLDSCGGGYKIDFFGLFPVPKLFAPSETLEAVSLALHVYGSYLFYILVSLHLIGVFKHQFILKDGLLRRMLP